LPGGKGSGQNNGNTKKLRHRICVSYTEKTSVGNSEYSSICLHSAALMSVQLIVLNISPCERIATWETCPLLKKDIIGANLVTVSMAKTVTLGVSRATVSKVMSAYMNHGKTSSV
jgi:hypothetical protein